MPRRAKGTPSVYPGYARPRCACGSVGIQAVFRGAEISPCGVLAFPDMVPERRIYRSVLITEVYDRVDLITGATTFYTYLRRVVMDELCSTYTFEESCPRNSNGSTYGWRPASGYPPSMIFQMSPEHGGSYPNFTFTRTTSNNSYTESSTQSYECDGETTNEWIVATVKNLLADTEWPEKYTANTPAAEWNESGGYVDWPHHFSVALRECRWRLYTSLPLPRGVKLVATLRKYYRAPDSYDYLPKEDEADFKDEILPGETVGAARALTVDDIGEIGRGKWNGVRIYMTGHEFVPV